MAYLSSDSGSDLEQASLLTSQRQTSWVRLRLGGLLVGLVGLVVALICVFGGVSPELPGAERSGVVPLTRLGRMSGLVQAYAMEKGRRILTGSEMDSLYSHVAEGRHPKARALMDRFSKAGGLGEHEQSAEEIGLSEACVDAIKSKLKEAFERFAKLLVEAFFGCIVDDEESDACEAANSKMDSFMEDLVVRCQAEGDFCNITTVEMKHGKKLEESLGVCVPSACHKEAKKAIEYFKEQLGEQMDEAQAQADAQGESLPSDMKNTDDCENCTINIECAAAQGASRRTRKAAVKDAEELQDAERLSI